MTTSLLIKNPSWNYLVSQKSPRSKAEYIFTQNKYNTALKFINNVFCNVKNNKHLKVQCQNGHTFGYSVVILLAFYGIIFIKIILSNYNNPVVISCEEDQYFIYFMNLLMTQEWNNLQLSISVLMQGFCLKQKESHTNLVGILLVLLSCLESQYHIRTHFFIIAWSIIKIRLIK